METWTTTPPPPRTREVEAAREDAKTVSSQILNVIDLDGEVTEPGPGISPCDGSDSDRRFNVRLLDERGQETGQRSMINVRLVSACFQGRPEGQKVEGL